ncbi:MAG: hypothetical protein FWG03_07305 [Clostridiales bacterium]|nr:hypothetical protein [Clostridiales bacterium]
MDSNKESNNEKKKMSAALKLTIVFICVAAALTFFSKTMYNAGIPVVQVSPVMSEQLRIVHTGEGFVVPKETAPLYAPGDLVITEVLVKQYDVVEEGDVLAAFDVSGVEAGRKEQCMELRAPFDGVITGVSAHPGMMAGRYEPLFELSNTELGYVVRLVVPMEYARFFYKAKISIFDTIHTIPGTIISRAPVPGGGVELTIELEPGRAQIKPDMLAVLELTHVTEKFSAIVPYTAIFDEAFVYKLIETEGPLGMEYRVKRIPVEIIVRGEGLVAVTGDLRQRDEVVVSSDRPLADERVKVFKEW